MRALEGRTVIVTGAGQGIGRSIALQSAAAGARVVVNDIGAVERDGVRVFLAETVVEEIRAAGGRRSRWSRASAIRRARRGSCRPRSTPSGAWTRW